MTPARWFLAGLLAAALSGTLAPEDPPAPPLTSPAPPIASALSSELSAELRALALEFSPLPDVPADPTNRVADDPAAARLGQALFFDKRLSGPGTVSCATCHDPALGWGDGRPLAKGVANHPRHSMTLWNVAYNRWFFWDGRKDSLWSQALGPLEDPREHGSSRLQLVHVVADDPAYVRAYEGVFGPLPDLHDAVRFPPQGRPVDGDDGHVHALAWATMSPDDQLLVNEMFANMGKSIAAFQRKIVSRHAPFDVFVEGLRSADPVQQSALSDSAQRGFALFAGRAQCIACHDGPQFTDKEFHTNLVPTGEGDDPGRGLGVMRLKGDPFNGASVFADDGGERARSKLSFPRGGWELPGSFKTPTLRNVAATAPYMHEGQIATLEEVIEFYSTLENAAKPGLHDEKILRPLQLSDGEKADLMAFLISLTDEELPVALLKAPVTPYLP